VLAGGLGIFLSQAKNLDTRNPDMMFTDNYPGNHTQMSEEPMAAMDSPLSILVVDDDELNQRMMRLLLKREGHQIKFASNGLEAVEAVKSGKFDLILMDLQMPVMDGVEASRQIRAWENGGSHTYIVALTASYLPEKGHELFEAGLDNYMPKPFDVDHLRNILQYSLESRRSRLTMILEQHEVAPPASEQLMDFEKGIQRVGGQDSIYKDFLNDFVEELPGRLENLWSHYRNKDMEGLYRAAHNLKGVSANLGALQLSDHAKRLEKQASQGYTESIEPLLTDISYIIRASIEAAMNYLAAGK
jgi:CheY-like chemotaxis protein/HPt (histidine-containing phosphotransfer) domain-containing protein